MKATIFTKSSSLRMLVEKATAETPTSYSPKPRIPIVSRVSTSHSLETFLSLVMNYFKRQKEKGVEVRL